MKEIPWRAFSVEEKDLILYEGMVRKGLENSNNYILPDLNPNDAYSVSFYLGLKGFLTEVVGDDANCLVDVRKGLEEDIKNA